MKIHDFFIMRKKGFQILQINVFFILFFAIAYYVQDYIISYYPEFSEKYLLLPKNKKKVERNEKEKSLFTLKSPLYYLWFSLITQSTVGYNGVLSKNNKFENFEIIRSIPFKIINILQITSIFITPVFIL